MKELFCMCEYTAINYLLYIWLRTYRPTLPFYCLVKYDILQDSYVDHYLFTFFSVTSSE